MMRKLALAGVAGVLLGGGSFAQAALTVDPGDWSFLQDSGIHRISIGIDGSGNVMGSVVMLQIAGAGTLPKLVGGEIVTGTIFQGNSDPPNTDFNDPTCAYLDVATQSGTVAVTGPATLAFVDVDTNGASIGVYTLSLIGTTFGDSDVQTNPPETVTFLGGTFEVTVPEPMLAGTLASGSVMLLVRKRQKR